ncbi:hypothetical protein FZEAL_6893 [Fusarium zealandicum]|uniref:Uncharacterized protein n=1 Tax=Fusarium zealandicum TaxID=1053134 RepID=A0A8H4UHN4_9HYPO|nr:hypothetical protein FZEAL_6893 [Fusarium zealandicum]
MILADVFAAIASIGAFFVYCDERGAGPAPYAPSELSILARVRYYVFNRRFWELFQAYHVAMWAQRGICGLEPSMSPLTPMSFAKDAALGWLCASVCTRIENRGDLFQDTKES